MIYEYPEEFVVPVVYVEGLKEKSSNRNWEFKYLHVDKSMTPSEKPQEDKMFQMSKYHDEDISNKGMEFLDLDEDLLQKPCHGKYKFDDVVESEEEHYGSNDIFNDIDNEYADVETLRM
ncbi:hypothetical protein [Clostridium beijerinckii]|uniref:hypothetical protein n=1 Tax=Clostridium beijerinckii TaxID=1520 RepID=UPI00047D4163|nr:hypothetical protein [Clostridium beijerinckii]